MEDTFQTNYLFKNEKGKVLRILGGCRWAQGSDSALFADLSSRSAQGEAGEGYWGGGQGQESLREISNNEKAAFCLVRQGRF